MAQEQFKAQQGRFKAQLHKLLPQMADANHADAVATRKMLEANPWLSGFANPELEALVRVRGLKVLEAEIKARTAPARPAGSGAAPVVPRGKPAGASGAAAPRASDAGRGVAEAKSRVEKERSLGALAALVGATE